MKAIFGSILIAAVFTTLPLSAQTPDNENDNLLNLVKELTIKQAQLVDNEGKIEIKVTDLAEAIRVARLLMSRAGGPHIAPSPGSNVPVPRPPPPAQKP
jgi:hypothetical protein